MLNKCLYLRFRKKQSKTYCYCTKKRSVMESFECNGCLAKTKSKTRIKTISKKRETVSKKTYEEVYDRCNGVCYICGTNKNLHLHHIDGREKNKTDNPNNCIMLCSYCHLEIVHKNNKYWRGKLKEMV